MATFHYDLTGAEPILRDMPVYDAAAVAYGEMMMFDTTANQLAQYITGYTGGAGEMVDAIGMMNEDITTTSEADYGDTITTAATTATPAISSIAATVTTGNRYGKIIINPFAVYLLQYSEAAADDVALTQAWSTTTLTLTSLEDNIDGGWIFCSEESATSGFAGQIRYIAASPGAGSCTLLNAPTVAGGTSDTIVKVLPVGHRVSSLNAGATGLLSQAAAGSGVSLCIVENYIGGKTRPLEPLRAQVHAGTDNGAGNTKVYADIQLMNHIWNPLS